MTGMSVMIVEPEFIVAKSLESWLSNHGFTVPVIVSTGSDAIREAERFRPDLVVIDTVLKGGESGIDVAKALRSSLDIPSVQLATFADEFTGGERDLAEISGYLIKPFSEKSLQLAVGMALSRHRMERKVEESREWLEAVVRSIGDAVITTDREGRITSMNPAAERTSGWDCTEAAGKPFDAIVHAARGKNDIISSSGFADLAGVSGNGNLPGDITLTPRSGPGIPIEGTIAAMQDAAGKNYGTVVVYRDITERKKSEETLRHYEDYLEDQVRERTKDLLDANRRMGHEIAERGIAESALAAERDHLDATLFAIEDGVIATDNDGYILFMNRIAEELTGWDPRAARSMDIAAVFCLEAGLILPPGEPGGEKSTISESETLVSRTGKKFSIAKSVSPIRTREGQVAGSVITFRDITAKLRAEREYIRNQNLASIGVLAGGVAHDLNNILTAIVGNLALCRISAGKDREMQYLDEAERGLFQVRDVARQLLTFSHGGAPVRRVTSVRALIADTMSGIREGSGIRVEISVPDDLWEVNVDEAQIGQAIKNIVLNAQEAMARGGVLRITAHNEIVRNDWQPLNPGRACVRISIADEGVGIGRDDMQKIFDPYFSTKPGSAGIGLTAVHSILRRHGGFVDVDSEQGRGSTFNLVIPAIVKGSGNSAEADAGD